MSTAVKYYDSTMSGAPSLSGTAGALVGVLDACLVDGFGSVTVDSLTVASNVATATISSGHQFAMVGNTGPVITIAGANPSGLNSNWRVTVTSSTEFTFATSGIGDQTATGTITAKRAPAGFSKAFSDTDKAAYQSLAIDSTQCLLRVDDTPVYSAACIGFSAIADQAAFDAATGDNPFPASSNYGWCRSYYNTSDDYPWVIIADDRFFYMHCDYLNGQSQVTLQCFGDIVQALSTDSYHCLLARGVNGVGGTQPSGGSAVNTSMFSASLTNMVFPKSYTQLGSSGISGFLTSTLVTTWGSSSVAYPDAVTNSLIIAPISVHEGNALIRGHLPGMYAPLNNFSSGSTIHKTVLTSVAGLDNHDVILLCGYRNAGAVAFDITGPWR
jgi:hypothetical protein